MTLHRIVWQSKAACVFTVLGEGQPFEAKATPVVTSYYFGTTVGLYFRTTDAFGYWRSSNACSPITAWRVAQLLPQLKIMRNRREGYDATLCGLVIAMNGDRHVDRMYERAKDLGMTVEELDNRLTQLNELWPTAAELCRMWDRLSADEQENWTGTLRKAIAEGHVEATQDLTNRLDAAELRLRTLAQQEEHENALIAAGLESEVSLRQLLLDIGVTNLIYSVGYGEMGDPFHFDFDNLDREAMTELIGNYGGPDRIPLFTTEKQPDDESAHQVQRDGGITVYTRDFGATEHPCVLIGREYRELIDVRWDNVTERFVLTLRRLGLSERDDSHDETMSIRQLRARIGADTELGRPLAPGEMPAWAQKLTARSGLGRLFGFMR